MTQNGSSSGLERVSPERSREAVILASHRLRLPSGCTGSARADVPPLRVSGGGPASVTGFSASVVRKRAWCEYSGTTCTSLRLVQL